MDRVSHSPRPTTNKMGHETLSALRTQLPKAQPTILCPILPLARIFIERWRVRRSKSVGSRHLSLLLPAFFLPNSIIIYSHFFALPTAARPESHPGASFKFNHIRGEALRAEGLKLHRKLFQFLLKGLPFSKVPVL